MRFEKRKANNTSLKKSPVKPQRHITGRGGSSSRGLQTHGDTMQGVGTRASATLFHDAGQKYPGSPHSNPAQSGGGTRPCRALCSLVPPPPWWGRRLHVTSHMVPRPLNSGNLIKAVRTNCVVSVREVASTLLLHHAVTATKTAKFLGEPEETVLPSQQASDNPAAHWCWGAAQEGHKNLQKTSSLREGGER